VEDREDENDGISILHGSAGIFMKKGMAGKIYREFEKVHLDSAFSYPTFMKTLKKRLGISKACMAFRSNCHDKNSLRRKSIKTLEENSPHPRVMY
jgi:hypothetical protein